VELRIRVRVVVAARRLLVWVALVQVRRLALLDRARIGRLTGLVPSFRLGLRWG
jgi:hypothetical protein